MKMMASRRQYTIRNIPASADRALRRMAKAQGKSLNALLLEILEAAADVRAEPREHRDLDHLIGTWIADPETDRMLSEQRQITRGDWS